MVTQQAQLHVMTRNPTKYNTFYHTVLEELLSQDLTMLHYKIVPSPRTPTNFVMSKWWHSRLMYMT